MIGVIDADNSYNTVYGAGYFGLGRSKLGKMTRVRYDKSHDGPWWRKWWEANRAKYPKAAQMEIPDLSSELAEGRHVAGMDLSPDELSMLRSFQFLSDRPVLRVLNVHEEKLHAGETQQAAESLGANTVVISARIEKEISELDPEERMEFIEGMGLGEPAAQRVIRACYEALGLRSFFTGAKPGDELRAWTIHAGDPALTAAGKVHTDMARGFIRAEVAAFEDVVECCSLKDARAQGKARLEGKEYEVQDGEVILFRFKV